MSTIVIGVDNGEASTRAVQFALDRTQGLNDLDLLLVHVIHWSPYSFNTPTENEERHGRREGEIAAAREQVIDPMLAIVTEAGRAAETVITHGNPSEAMIDIATEHEGIHIILGRTGDSGLREQVFGSVASRIVQHSPVPVTVVP